ncbi:hypothetical protein PISMIDRAFT_6494 [Pisolithus microcarpus 441]|uniref:Uncharacterized protein n=1 Tax=Pisolithus microcarpus 441 TaxID=765257 RepID=A0A0D0ACB3_9AGAM|nr:hypothetical protein BKA83DRAFT_6494 [Pisolithus microcarpus]KIK29698.1 hypothetical protein PISMIDRAFT_6494 [Pisolithus microcarpus 441]
MPTTVKRVSPFYDDDSVALPPLSSKLTDQVELFGQTPRPMTLLADEHLTPAGLGVVPPKFSVANRSGTPRSTPAPEFRVMSKASRRGASPYAKKVAFQGAAAEQTNSTDESSSEASSDDDSTVSTISDESKIPKPQGEPGHPGRGGYTLEAALDWNHSAYMKFKKLTHRLIEEHLDTTKCASAQNPASLKLVRDKAMAAFPDLENYTHVWPVSDMIMMHLKYTSSRARRREVEMAAGKKYSTRSTV